MSPHTYVDFAVLSPGCVGALLGFSNTSTLYESLYTDEELRPRVYTGLEHRIP